MTITIDYTHFYIYPNLQLIYQFDEDLVEKLKKTSPQGKLSIFIQGESTGAYPWQDLFQQATAIDELIFLRSSLLTLQNIALPICNNPHIHKIVWCHNDENKKTDMQFKALFARKIAVTEHSFDYRLRTKKLTMGHTITPIRSSPYMPSFHTRQSPASALTHSLETQLNLSSALPVISPEEKKGLILKNLNLIKYYEYQGQYILQGIVKQENKWYVVIGKTKLDINNPIFTNHQFFCTHSLEPTVIYNQSGIKIQLDDDSLNTISISLDE
jgi:hypothetical protein